MLGLGADISPLKASYKINMVPRDVRIRYETKLSCDSTNTNTNQKSNYLNVGNSALELRPEINKSRMKILSFGEENKIQIIDQINQTISTSTFEMNKTIRKEHVPFLNKLGSNGFAPIHTAVREGNFEIVQFLVEKCYCDINLLDSSGRTPLLNACKLYHLNIIELLLERNNINANTCTKSNNRSALHYLSSFPILELKRMVLIYKKLIDKGLDLNGITIKQGYLPAHYAATHGNGQNIALLKFFNSSIVKSCLNGMTPIQMSARENKYENVRTFLSFGVSIEELSEGSKDSSYSNDISEMYKKKEIPEIPNYYNEISNAEFLILPEIYAPKDHNHVIHDFLKSKPKNAELLKFIKKEGSTCLLYPNLIGRISIHLVSEYGINELISTLIDKFSVPIDRLDIEGNSCLHIAAQFGNIKTCEILLEHEANPNFKNQFGNILHSLSFGKEQLQSQCKELVGIILSNNNNQNYYMIDELNISGFSPLHIAAMSGNNIMITCLLENKADLDCLSKDGHTPLFYAMVGSKKSSVRLLRSRGASINWITPEFESTISPAILDVIKIVEPTSNRSISTKEMLNESNDNDPMQKIHSLTVTGNKQELRKLLKKNPKLLFSKDHEGSSVLHIAAFLQNQELMTFFIEKKLDPNIVNSKGYAPLIIAAKAGNLPVSFFFENRIKY